MNDYRLIFQKRANDYHLAMQNYPNARDNEFNTILNSINKSTVNTILDIPSGGGYLTKYLPKNLNIISSDFSEGFSDDNVKLVSPEKFPFESNSFDAVISLSGMHHLKNVPLFVEECLRVINYNGKFVFSDVKKDTPVDNFLNVFVNEFNSLGHQGDFFYEDYFKNYPNIQNKIMECKYDEYPFVFDNKENMIHFFKLFFGLDKANDNTIFEGVRDILGITYSHNKLEVNWGLIKFVLKK